MTQLNHILIMFYNRHTIYSAAGPPNSQLMLNRKQPDLNGLNAATTQQILQPINLSKHTQVQF